MLVSCHNVFVKFNMEIRDKTFPASVQAYEQDCNHNERLKCTVSEPNPHLKKALFSGASIGFLRFK